MRRVFSYLEQSKITQYISIELLGPMTAKLSHRLITMYLQQPLFYVYIIKPRRSRSAAAYSRQTFPSTICRFVGASVCPVHCGKTADRIRMPFGIICRTGPGMRQVVGLGIGQREGVLLGANVGHAIVINWDSTPYVCYNAATRPSSQITFGQTCFVGPTITVHSTGIHVLMKTWTVTSKKIYMQGSNDRHICYWQNK